MITPIVDYLVGRGDVDAKRIALTGWSMGGNLVIRAASREHRIAAIVSDPGALSLIASYLARGGDQIFGADVADPNAIWQGTQVTGVHGGAKIPVRQADGDLRALASRRCRAGKTFTDVKSFIDLVDAFTIPPDMAAAVTAHVLVTDYQLDQFFPGQPEQMLKLLTSAASRKLHLFTIAEGAEYHCAPLAPRSATRSSSTGWTSCSTGRIAIALVALIAVSRRDHASTSRRATPASAPLRIASISAGRSSPYQNYLRPFGGPPCAWSRSVSAWPTPRPPAGKRVSIEKRHQHSVLAVDHFTDRRRVRADHHASRRAWPRAATTTARRDRSGDMGRGHLQRLEISLIGQTADKMHARRIDALGDSSRE